jgi:peptidyl-prolyl cis-trans isomerase SurA
MKKIFFNSILICLSLFVTAQDKVLLEIDNDKISTGEFLYIYNKNKKNDTNSNVMSYDTMKEYMELFINFKLKVHEAMELGLDTMTSFKNELQGYISSSAQPYLIDKNVEEEVIKETYNRMLFDIRVSHIIIETKYDSPAEDTLKAYNKIYEVYNKLQKGADFGTMAKEYSDDQVSALEGGDLAYRTVYGFVLPFEDVMYNTSVGEISKPFRSQYGYHVLKVTDVRPAKGKYKVAHIIKVFPPEATVATKEKVKNSMIDVYNRLMAGESFEELVDKESMDRKTVASGGDLGWISVGGRMIRQFEEAVFKLEKVGDISPILETNYGFHIIKLLDIEPIKPFDEIKANIKAQIAGTERNVKAKNVILNKLKKEYNVKTYKENVEEFYKYYTDTTFFRAEYLDNSNVDLSKPVLTFKNKVFTQKDFRNSLMRAYLLQPEIKNVESFIDNEFNKFIDKNLIDYEESVLGEKYLDFKHLVNEYHDGILLFELTDKKVWTKAVKDTIGLQEFYKKNKDKYMWNFRYDIRTYKYKDEKSVKTLSKSLLKGMNEEKMLAKLNKKDSTAVVFVEKYLSEKNINFNVDDFIKKNNIITDKEYKNTIVDKENKTVTYIAVLPPQHKELNEARGIITADYQNYLESEWVKELRAKYKYVVHDDILRSISK